jgi:hypothetical protein
MEYSKYRLYIKKTNKFVYTNKPRSKFIGIYDNKLKPIYERDVLKFLVNKEEKIGEVCYSHDIAAFIVDVYPIMKLDIDKFEIIGNMEQDYYYNESGDITKKQNTDY